MITIPNKRPTPLKTYEVDFGSTIAEAIWRRIVQSINWYNAAFPVGSIMSFYQSQTFANGNPIPNPMGLMQFCNGAPVANSNSPLFGQNTPDFRELFLKGGASIGTLGGNLTINLSHNHGGKTGNTDDVDPSAARIDDGGEKEEHHSHAHFISSDLGIQSLVPPYIDLQHYMKVDGAATIDTFLTYLQLDDDYAKYGKIVSVELLQSIKSALDYLNAAFPIGDVFPIMTNIPGVTINPKILQECNGSEIIDTDSPLHSLPGQPRFTPNLVDRYIKFPATIGVVGFAGGQNTRSDLGHSHGGSTGDHGYGDNSDTDDDHYPSTGHTHSISSDLNGTYNVEPPFYTVKFYMRIQ